MKLAAGDFGIGIGDVPRLDGLRLNFRDRYLERVRGLNATLWMPYEDADGSVEGLLLGIPLTGAADMKGLAIGFGVGIERDFSGIALAPIGMGAGGRMRGLIVGGVGVGGGSDLDGILIGGVGGGIGGNLTGIAVGGIGVGVGGAVRGIVVGGVGVGVQALSYTTDAATVREISEATLLTSGARAASELIATVGYSRSFGDVDLGVSAKTVEPRLAGSKDLAGA
ncbi:MAG: hypothetical protein IIC35_02160, partial [Gemmatimonadetes bacterium]|nr:hypothetical protein [Gemmatimonadota bacterium]